MGNAEDDRLENLLELINYKKYDVTKIFLHLVFNHSAILNINNSFMFEE
jgi:hypothetical protein